MDVIRGDGSLLTEIDLAPANDHQAVIQNIAVILDTVQGSCPMFRDFGLPGSLYGRPQPVVENIDRTSASDATLRINTSVTTQTTDSNDTSVPFKDTKAVSGVTVPQILIASGLYPDAGQTTPGRFWARNNGERLPFRGSSFGSASYGGAGALYLSNARSIVYYDVSLRSALVE